MNNKQATLELGTKPVGTLLMQYALPAIVAMVASSLYNMVDSIFIGHTAPFRNIREQRQPQYLFVYIFWILQIDLPAEHLFKS